MQVITDITETKTFIANLLQSLVDPGYWKGWSALMVTTQPELDWIKQAKATALIRAQIDNGQGTIAWSEGAVLAVWEQSQPFDEKAYIFGLSEALEGARVTAQLLSVDQDNAKVHAMLVDCLGRSKDMAEEKEMPASYDFLKSMLPDIDDLLKNWHQTSEKRKDEGRTSPVLLVVDDDEMTLELISTVLRKYYTVHTAKNSAEAIAKHLQVKPDIIFLDIGLPDCDGLTALNYMQQYDKECRIVMFSADDYLKTRVKAFAGGAKGFLTKPFNLEGFQKHIAQWIATKK